MKKQFLTFLRNCLYFLILPGAIIRNERLQAQDWDSRARELVSQMTLQEKIEELHGIQNKLHQRYVPPIPRLHIPALRIANGPAGVGPADEHNQLPATALPAPILLAATWDPSLAHRYGIIIGREARDLNYGLLEGPDVNIARVPQNGRTFEAFGEDPYLVSQMAVAEIEGIQSQDVIAEVKHYVANNQESDRFAINEIVGERALREIYLPAFEASVKEARVAALMGAYPKVNGIFCCENDELLNQILKKEWAFKGFITSDFGAVHSTVPSALAGLDLEMPNGKYFGSALEAAVKSGEVPMSVIDDKLIRRFRTMMEFGLFDHPSETKPIPARQDGEVARQIAEDGMVLLKNTGGELPLNAANLRRIAVIGPYAEKAMTGGGGSSHVIPLYCVSPVEGIRQRVGSNVEVNFTDGTGLSQAVTAAKTADVAIVMVGDDETEGRDHPLTLAENQDQLVETVAKANPRTIVVLKSGTAMLMPWLDEVPALLEAWYPGEEDGNAVAAVLFGDVNPSGKLPLTFPKQLADLPANTPEQYPGVDGVVHYSEGVFVGYRHFDAQSIQPLFPFGYGLSYTTFAFKNLAVTPENISLSGNPRATVTVDLNVTNTGNRSGEEVVELYLGLPSTKTIPQPPKQLKAFAKVSLQPGQTRLVRLKLDAHSLRCWNTDTHGWDILPGTYRVMVGFSSRDLPLEGTFKVNAD
ncbi:MAG TPA: glycoside hydrolase family 3 C-terminal domain-containing protein [Candidatus Saccharimonadales bacterium]|nr:glycoside hydrolase family 3 C-terminal domain-containing protein [Candidatus Saccharimonadales bacterium]